MIRYHLTTFLPHLSTFIAIFFISGPFAESSAQPVEESNVKLTKCSEYRVETPAPDALGADAQRLYLGTLDGSVHALDTGITSTLWRSELGGEIVSNIAAAETGALLVSNRVKTSESVPTESVLRSLSKETGVPIWTTRLPLSDRFFLGVVQGNLAAISADGWVAAIEPQTGRILWRTPAFGRITAAPSFFTHGIALGTSEKQIVVVSAETGEISFRSATEFVPTAVTNSSPDGIVVGDERGNVMSIGIPNGKIIWRFKGGAAISFVSIAKEGLVVTSLDNFIYSIWMYNGDVIWKRRLSGRVTEGVLISDGLITALIYGENSAFLIDAKKGRIVDQLPEGEKSFVSRVPFPVNGSNILVTMPDSLVVYALRGCEHKIGKAASPIPPSNKAKIRSQ